MCLWSFLCVFEFVCEGVHVFLVVYMCTRARARVCVCVCVLRPSSIYEMAVYIPLTVLYLHDTCTNLA